ncbi:hypothetical protein ACHAW6_000635, partial [Cyclotella cf. meneghiniana]
MSTGTKPREPDAKANNGSREKQVAPATFTTPARDIYTYFSNTNNHHLSHTSSSRSKRKTFPMKLHEILSDVTYSDIIAWSPHGRSFRVVDKKRLLDVVGRKFFKFKNVNSFYRILNFWGFKRLRQPGPDNLAYYNEKFLQGLPQLAAQMKSQPVKSVKTSSNIRGKSKNTLNCGRLLPILSVLTLLSFSTDEPNFYEMAIEHPLPCKKTVEVPHLKKEAVDAGVAVDRKEEVQMKIQEEDGTLRAAVDPKDGIPAT